MTRPVGLWQEEAIDLWDPKFDDPFWIRIITTNGTIKKNGEVVMGRGCAKEARDRYPFLAKQLGDLISRFGNRMHFLPHYRLLSFPVKYNYWEKADMDLIVKSVKELQNFYADKPYLRFALPRPGCGNGGLNWKEVREKLDVFLVINVTIVSKPVNW